MNLLFMCVANSARSQLAEGLAKKILGKSAHVESAGSAPARVNPFAIQALKEIGIDIADHRSKGVSDLPREFVSRLDYVITLCAEEVCPVLPSPAKRLHWTHPDPASAGSTDAERLQSFRATRDSIQKLIIEFGREHGLL